MLKLALELRLFPRQLHFLYQKVSFILLTSQTTLAPDPRNLFLTLAIPNPVILS
jgi:hypothetical protein